MDRDDPDKRARAHGADAQQQLQPDDQTGEKQLY
jgi:hypothetical protein